HSAVPGVHHVDVSRGIHGQAVGALELAVAGAERSPFAKEGARGAEFLDAVVPGVGDVDVSGAVGVGAHRRRELRGRRPEDTPLENVARRGLGARAGGNQEERENESSDPSIHETPPWESGSRSLARTRKSGGVLTGTRGAWGERIVRPLEGDRHERRRKRTT